MSNKKPAPRPPGEWRGGGLMDFNADDWRMLCERLASTPESLTGAVSPEGIEAAIEEAHRMIGVLHHALGRACRGCGGVGRIAYGSTATWRGGIGGQAITEDVCNRCWGTGRRDMTGVNLRRLEKLLAARPAGDKEGV